MDTFEKRLQSIMGSKSQVDFANELGVTKQKIHNYVKGIVKPTYEVFLALSNKGYDVNWLLSGHKYNESDKFGTVNEQGIEYNAGYKKLPLYDRYEKDVDVKQWSNIGRKLYTLYVDRHYINPFCVKVIDDYMHPDIIINDVLLCSEDNVNLDREEIIFVVAFDDIGPRYASKKGDVIITSHNKNKAIKLYDRNEYKNIKIYKINKLIRDWS